MVRPVCQNTIAFNCQSASQARLLESVYRFPKRQRVICPDIDSVLNGDIGVPPIVVEVVANLGQRPDVVRCICQRTGEGIIRAQRQAIGSAGALLKAASSYSSDFLRRHIASCSEHSGKVTLRRNLGVTAVARWNWQVRIPLKIQMPTLLTHVGDREYLSADLFLNRKIEHQGRGRRDNYPNGQQRFHSDWLRFQESVAAVPAKVNRFRRGTEYRQRPQADR